jgi:4-amino-4-deoxy-L-arabinose transferase-like glycosyltransferase
MPAPEPSGGLQRGFDVMVWRASAALSELRPNAAYGAWVLGGLALVAVLIFDLAPPLAYNDDWVMAWSVRHLVQAHSLTPFPAQSAEALVQTIWAAVATLGHPDQRFLRLSLLPFAVLASVSSYWMARTLGAHRFWSALAGVTLLGSPLFLTLATTFMTDVPSLALLLAASAAGLVWVCRGQARGWCLLFTGLAVLERQTNVVIPVAVGIALLLARRERRVSLRDWQALAGLCAVVGLATLLPVAVGIAPPTVGNRLTGLLQLDWHRLSPLASLGSMLGLALLPFSAAMVSQPVRAVAAERRWLRIVPIGLGVSGLAACLLGFLSGRSIFPGNVLTPIGFTPSLGGAKPPIFPVPIFVLVSLLVIGNMYLLLIHRRAVWTSRQVPLGQLFLLVASLSQFAFLFAVTEGIFDRYFLPVAALLVPLLAVWASHNSRPRLAATWAVGVVAAGQVAYLVGQQDYVAWQGARDLAARQAYALAAPAEVNAGYEANGTYVVIPTYEQRGAMLEDLAASRQSAGFATLGPRHPRVVLLFAAANDPRPGVTYRSLAPGRIVLQLEES